MMLHALFNGLGIALSYTVINIIIIDKQLVDSLPYLYVGSSVLLLITGYFYSKLEHHHDPSKIFKGVLIIGVIWSLFLFVNMSFSHSVLVITIAFTTYFLIYLLNNLEFWGAAALIFNVRQGKRLFSLLSVGESVAKIAGYSLTPLVITLFDPQTVFLIVGLAFLGSYFVFLQLEKRFRPNFQKSHEHAHQKDEHTNKEMSALSVSKILNVGPFTKYISIFALVATLCYFLLQFTFLDQIKYSFTNVKDIAIFFAWLFSVAKFLNLIIKFLIAGRLLQFMGLKFVLLLLPIVLLIASGIGLIGIFNWGAEGNYLIWIFSIIIILDETLRSSLYTPSYLLLFQPLSKEKRLEGHTLSKGIMEPIGIGLAGLIILFLFYIDHFELQYMIMIILVCILIWIFAGNEVYKAYIGELQKALKSKFLHRGTLQLSKEEISSLKDKLINGTDPNEHIYVLKLLGNEITTDAKVKFIRNLIVHENDLVSFAAIEYTGEHELLELSDDIKHLIDHDSHLVSKAAIKVYSELQKEECIHAFQDKIHELHPERKKTMISASIKHGGLHGAVNFGKDLLTLVKSEDESERIFGAHIIKDIGINEFYFPLIALLEDPSVEVRKAALDATTVVNHPSLTDHILKIALTPNLFSSGKRSINSMQFDIKDQLSAKFSSSDTLEKVRILKLINKRKFTDTKDIIFAHLEHECFEVKQEAITAIFIRNFVSSAEDIEQIRILIAALSKNVQFLCKYYPEINNEAIKRAVRNEVDNIQMPLIYYCLSYIYSKTQIIEIIENTNIKLEDYRSNALELLENLLSNKDKRIVIPVAEKVYDLISLPSTKGKLKSTEILINHVIQDQNNQFSAWLVANCIREAKLQGFNIQYPNSLHQSPHLVIRDEMSANKLN